MTDLEMLQGPLALSVSGLCKRFGGVAALDDVTLGFPQGQVTAVLGENGAGKSTLMNILAGLLRPDAGAVTVGDQAVSAYSPTRMLHEHRIALVPQEIALCEDRTVAENVLLGQEPGALPSRRRMVDQTRSLLRQLDLPIDPRLPAARLRVAEKQLVLIARALARDCRLIIFDEPTTSLTPYEASRLLDLIRRLRAGGTTIVYVSHRLPEIVDIADWVHVLRDGRHVATMRAADVTVDRLVTAMVGRELSQSRSHGHHEPGPTVLEVASLSTEVLRDVSLSVASGEIVGVAGLPDSGNSQLVAALFGAIPSTGTTRLDGREVRLRSPRDAMRAGVGYVPAERRSQALFPDLSVAQNATVLDVDSTSRFGLVSHRRLRRTGAQRLAEYDVRGTLASTVVSLSGGNQQKVILSRWLARKPRLLLLDDPTRGVDVGAKSEIHDRLLDAARSGGAAVLMASSDLPELLRVCDRIIVLWRGRLMRVLDATTSSETEVMAYATNTTSSSTT